MKVKIDKQFIVRNLITILCGLCVLALFFNLMTMSVEVESSFIGTNSETTTTGGWSAIFDYPLGWILILGPALLVGMNYIKKLEKFKGLLAIFIPILCISILLLTYFDAKKAAMIVNGAVDAVEDFSYGYGDDFGIDTSVKVSAGLGFYLLLLANLGMIVSGAVTYFGFRLNDLSSMKESGMAILNSARDAATMGKESLSNLSFSSNHETTEDCSEPSAAPEASAEVPSAPVARTTESTPTPAADRSRGAKPTKAKYSADESLALIERLAKMRESGILSDEEFQEKKTELLKGV